MIMLPLLLASCAGIKHGETLITRAGLVDLATLSPPLLLDIRYATANNFTGRAVYPAARALLQRDAALALARVNASLREQGLQLKVFDAYRPLSVQKIFWAILPDERYVANPKLGSMHNRGMAVDVTLCDMAGQELPMPTGYDDFSEKAHRDYQKLPTEVLRNRQTLQEVMEKEGFHGIPTEWWHFDCRGWSKYPVLDIPIPD